MPIITHYNTNSVSAFTLQSVCTQLDDSLASIVRFNHLIAVMYAISDLSCSIQDDEEDGGLASDRPEYTNVKLAKHVSFARLSLYTLVLYPLCCEKNTPLSILGWRWRSHVCTTWLLLTVFYQLSFQSCQPLMFWFALYMKIIVHSQGGCQLHYCTSVNLKHMFEDHSTYKILLTCSGGLFPKDAAF